MPGILKEGVNPHEFNLDDIDVPKGVSRLIVLNAIDAGSRDWEDTLVIDGEPTKVQKTPLIDIEFTSEAQAHEAVLSAMGYSEKDTPRVGL